ncbi:MAG: hypothetical protein HQL36_02525 [Alphaproteobacteria bacterium]|nr:hypothetical protein [Alphaproteobacteria bacterium]MBF0251135.1 hypothetical protein [Alphaproteobacteria bacterium]
MRIKPAPLKRLAACAAACLLAGTAAAQDAATPGQVRIQGQIFAVPDAGSGEITAPLVEVIPFRDEMRAFVQNISAYARSLKPGFVVIGRGGLGLVTKPNPEDDTQAFPARTFMRAIDGVMETGLSRPLPVIKGNDGKPKKLPPEVLDAHKRQEENIDTAIRFGVPVFDLDYAQKPAEIDKLYFRSAKRGLIPFVAGDEVMGQVPRWPKGAYRANPKSLTTAGQAENFLYVANSQAFGSGYDYIQALRDSNHDIVVVDVYHGRTPLTPDAINQLKYKKLGSRRLVLAQLDISSAATYHFFWQPHWKPGDPEFIGNPIAEDPDRHRVRYWKEQWQGIVSGNTSSYIYGIIDLGFDGVVLNGLDAWHFYETGGEDE